MDSPPSPVFLLSGGSLWSCKQWCTWESQTDMWDTDRPLPQQTSLVHRRKNTGVIMMTAFQLAEVLLLWITVSFSLLCYSGQLQITGVAWQVDQMKVIGLNPCSEVGIYLSEICSETNCCCLQLTGSRCCRYESSWWFSLRRTEVRTVLKCFLAQKHNLTSKVKYCDLEVELQRGVVISRPLNCD